MPRLISIGNSFSTDAQSYLHKLTMLTDDKFSTANLYIGGCSLEKHWNNLSTEQRAYDYEYNGESTGLKVSIQDAFENTTYSIVTIQQQSLLATDYATYQPYLKKILDYVREKQPNAQIYLQQTWPYEKNSSKLEKTQFKTSWEMFQKLKESYAKAAQEECLKIIPSGEAIMNALMSNLSVPMHRDGFHASLTYGRYLLGLTWLITLTGKIPTNYILPTFSDKTIPDPDICKTLLDCAVKAVKNNGIALK